ncbi:type II toxin-antitoxin system RelE/ParE family toxin [Paenibacillus tyrfis]|uniref:type II toxin-antitoxin system RelE/ParE family toxin n=1 Tax=Paenibacillus tyrfis TaxID=1501230 RepID=UPI00209E4283|nr:type II toxin-antitoxin system RelE/ParE family toxin [Paenibacillus tyrfis]MCP1309580.1 type II toxin-antitoxin system RelE/ParE family toxin [Paenibacillus tyrfis]
MAKSVVWTKTATNDLERAVEYIHQDSPGYALSFLYDAMERAKTLSLFPNRGRIVPEINNPNVREIFLHRYRMIYKIEEDQVIILSFIHGATNWNGR